MNSVSVLCFVAIAISAVSGRPGFLSGTPYSVPYVSPYVAAPYIAGGQVSTQYHSQDDFGQYSYGYNNGFDSKTEHKTLDGVTRGSYSYVDAEGKLQSVHYTADPVFGYRVAATNLPEDKGVAPTPVEDTPEVAQAKAEHLAAVEQAKKGIVAPAADLPTPVEDTPEVAQAKAEHLKAVEEAKVRNALAPVETPVAKYVTPYTVPSFKVPIATPYVPIASPLASTISSSYNPFTYSPYYYSPLSYSGYLGNHFNYATYPYTYKFPEIKSDVVTKVGFPYA